MLHRAPCSVLVARASADAEGFPRTAVVAVDGSAAAARALASACELRDRLGTEVRAVIALQEGKCDHEAARVTAAERGVPLEEIGGAAADVLVGSESQLLVVGSRGLRGLHALGSVSERVAHRSPASVLVVR
jgi:nucleotide-binding universal stress UspA family protein